MTKKLDVALSYANQTQKTTIYNILKAFVQKVPNKFRIAIAGRPYGEETIDLSIDGNELTQTNTVSNKFVSCTRKYKKSDSSATDDFTINYKQRLTALTRHSALKTTK